MLQILCWAAAFILFGMAGIFYYLLCAVPPKEVICRYRCNQCGKTFIKYNDECDACKSRQISSFNDLVPTEPRNIDYGILIGLVVAGVTVILLANSQADKLSNIKL